MTLLQPQQAAGLLEARTQALTDRLAALDADAAWASHVPRVFLIEDEYQRAMLQAELDWVCARCSTTYAPTASIGMRPGCASKPPPSRPAPPKPTPRPHRPNLGAANAVPAEPRRPARLSDARLSPPAAFAAGRAPP